MKADTLLKKPVTNLDAVILLAGFSLSIALIFIIQTPNHFWRFLGSYHLYVVWMVYGALFLKKERFYWAALTAIPIFLLFQYFIYYFSDGSLRSWVRYTVPPALDMLTIFGLLFIYHGQLKEKQSFLETKQTEIKKRLQALQHELQKQRIQTENMERLIRNQEYTFSLVYKIFRSFLTSGKGFTQALYQSVARITRAEKMVIYRVKENALTPEMPVDSFKDGEISFADDPFLKKICRGKKVISISEISKNDRLFSIWKQSSHRGLIYIPIHEASSLKYLVSVDKMPFAILHQRTLQALNYVKKMAELALTVSQKIQESQSSRSSQWHQVLQSPHDFLSFVENEFQRARRFHSSFSLIAIRTQTPQSNLTVAKLLQSIQAEIRELDQIYLDKPRSLVWIILPFTAFYEMSGILNRLSKRLKHLGTETGITRAFDYGFSVFEPDYESSKTMMKQVLEVLQIHAKILEKMSHRHVARKVVHS